MGISPSPNDYALPLTDFQWLMHAWDKERPFSAIDVIEAQCSVDATALSNAVEEELLELGVGWPAVSADGRTMSFAAPRGPVVVKQIKPSSELTSRQALANQCSSELNRAFDTGEPCVRVWILQTEPHAHIGMTWQHWPMDGVTGAELFRRIVARFAGHPCAAPAAGLDLVVPDLNAILAPWHTWRRKAFHARLAIREMFGFARTFAVPRPRKQTSAYHVSLLDLQHPIRPPGATANDVVAAALLWALAHVLDVRHRKWWRRGINLINFVDLRPHGGDMLQRAWGCYLAYCTFFMPEPRPNRFDDLISFIRDQSLWVRQNANYMASLSGFGILRTVWRMLPRRWRERLPYSLFPYTAGLTNTRFRNEWAFDPQRFPFGRSRRIAPASPMAPLVVDVCTKGDQMSLAITCEADSFLHDKVGAIMDTLSSLLNPGGA